jgi:hypothetical protein
MRLSIVLFLAVMLPSVCLAESERRLKKKKLTLLDKIQYPYDAWLPQETEDPAQRREIPSLSQPFYGNVIDVRATVSAKDTELILSTAGNWQFALTKLLNDTYFVDNESVKESYLVTVSPPISVQQMVTGLVKVGNILYKDAQPTVAIGPQPVMEQLSGKGFIPDGFTPFPIYQNYGNVILKLKGNRKIKKFADLVKIEPGRFASATVGAVKNYRNSIRDIFDNNPKLAKKVEAKNSSITTGEHLVARLFDEGGVAAIGPPMHQSIPHVLVTGQADAGLMLLELAVGIMRNNPGVFEAIYLANDKTGSTDDPEVLKEGQDPLEGTVVVTILATKTTTNTTVAQEIAQDNFLQALNSTALTAIFADSGLRRPDNFTI